MTDTNLLEKWIVKSGKKKKFLAARVGLSSAGFRNCCKNRAEFTARQITILCDQLDIKDLQDRQRIFFAQDDACDASRKDDAS